MEQIELLRPILKTLGFKEVKENKHLKYLTAECIVEIYSLGEWFLFVKEAKGVQDGNS